MALPLAQSIGQQRDFEGVGGWRLDPPSDEESLWTNINARLELPADHIRRHRRSVTGGSAPVERIRGERSYSPEMVMIGATSPNTGKARTPPTGGSGVGVENYFGGTGGGGGSSSGSPRSLKKTASGLTANSGSSTSSKASGVLSMKQR